MELELLSITPNAEKLIEEAGRTCYLSFDRIKEDSHKKFIRMIVKSGHHSVLEHPVVTFRVKGGSRSFTHQLVRHRLCSFSQQSQRFVNEENFAVIEPGSIQKDPRAHKLFAELVENARKTYIQLQELGIKNEDARFILPNAVQSEIVVSANFREWRHIFEVRGHPSAQWEIRRFAIEALRILKEHAPTVFEDFEIDEEKQVIFRVTPT